jgi:transcriptional regulator with XRE-family HTH domain
MVAEWFGARLRELRTAAGWTQQELADRAGITLGAVRHLEQGLRGPTWETVLSLAGALGTDCLAFTQKPADQPAPERGRPRKAKAPPATENTKAKAKKGKRAK